MQVSWKSCRRGLVGSLVAATAMLSGAAVADDWSFNEEIPCATAPVSGMQFQRCWISQARSFRIGAVRAWRLSFGDSNSESSIGFYKLVEAHGFGGCVGIGVSAFAGLGNDAVNQA